MAHLNNAEELQLLQQRLQEAQERADRAERERQQERQRADRAEEQIRLTTLDEYIAACHHSVFSKFCVETDKTLTTKGPITDPRNKWCPTKLKRWPNFINQQRVIFGTLYDTFPRDRRLFESEEFLAGLGNRISERSIANEKALENFLHNSVEHPVQMIMGKLKQVNETKSEFNIANGIVFENHPNAISDAAKEVIDRETPSSTPQTPNHKLNLNQLRPDQICIYRSNDGPSERTMIYVCEYKAPHKLTALHLRAGLQDMNILQKVVNRRTIPTSAVPDELFQYNAERLTASAVTQTYHYMIEGGLEYSLLTTGEAIVFLHINWEQPETLYYHLAEPSSEVSAHPNHMQACTAVGQYLAFTLMALGTPDRPRREHGQEERQTVMEGLSTWAEDFETTLRSMSKSERSLSSSASSGYEPTTYEGFDRSPHFLSSKKTHWALSDPPEEVVRRDQTDSSDDDESATKPPDTPTPKEPRSRRQGGQETRRSQQIVPQQSHEGGRGEQGRKYCTQKCLLGLVRRDFLDPKCPNSAFHCGPEDGDKGPHVRHPVDHARWLHLLREQLERSLDEGITPLGVGGARSVLFQVTMLAYGYTFVSKGTVRAFIRDLEHEAAVYKCLRPIQGVNVPVFLGVIDLRSMNKTYYYDHRVYVVHLMFLSWGGNHIDTVGSRDSERKSLETMTMRSLGAIHEQGVIHRDVRVPNMLFNLEINGVMMIDFERASLVKLPSLRAQLVTRKRARKQATEVKKAAASSLSLSDRGFREDVSMAGMALLGWNL